MSQILARIELHGEPDGDIYDQLHDYMESIDWNRALNDSDGAVIDLPHATYEAEYEEDKPDLAAIAEELEQYIHDEIWEGSTILVMRVADWAIRVTD